MERLRQLRSPQKRKKTISLPEVDGILKALLEMIERTGCIRHLLGGIPRLCGVMLMVSLVCFLDTLPPRSDKPVMARGSTAEDHA